MCLYDTKIYEIYEYKLLIYSNSSPLCHFSYCIRTAQCTGLKCEAVRVEQACLQYQIRPGKHAKTAPLNLHNFVFEEPNQPRYRADDKRKQCCQFHNYFVMHPRCKIYDLRSVDLAALLAGLEARLPSYARPIFIRLVDKIDLTGNSRFFLHYVNFQLAPHYLTMIFSMRSF